MEDFNKINDRLNVQTWTAIAIAGAFTVFCVIYLAFTPIV